MFFEILYLFSISKGEIERVEFTIYMQIEFTHQMKHCQFNQNIRCFDCYNLINYFSQIYIIKKTINLYMVIFANQNEDFKEVIKFGN